MSKTMHTSQETTRRNPGTPPQSPVLGKGPGGKDVAPTYKLDAVRDGLGNLKRLYEAKREASTDYADALDAVATKAGLDKAALNAFVAASCSEKPAQRRERARQLELLFDELGA
jgi:hypothetical protein